jgi:hypothetical protein
VIVENGAESDRDLVDRLFRGDGHDAIGPVALRGEETIGRVVEQPEAPALDAREAARQRMVRITRDVYGLPVFDVDEQAAQR